MRTVSAFESDTPIDRDYAPLVVAWTREDCKALKAAGFLTYRYELIEGVIIRKMGQNRQHSLCVTRAMVWLIQHFDPDCVQTQSSIYVADSDNRVNQPEPDVALLKRPLQELETDQPLPDDVQLVIEVADSTLLYDRGSKAGLYARAQIAEYWVVSVDERKLYVHTDPANGVYTRAIFEEGDVVAPRHALQATVRISDWLTPIPLETEMG